MTAPRRGRPPTGARKETLQVPLDAGDLETIDRAAEAMGKTRAELARMLIKHMIEWQELEKAAGKKGRK